MRDWSKLGIIECPDNLHRRQYGRKRSGFVTLVLREPGMQHCGIVCLCMGTVIYNKEKEGK